MYSISAYFNQNTTTQVENHIPSLSQAIIDARNLAVFNPGTQYVILQNYKIIASFLWNRSVRTGEVYRVWELYDGAVARDYAIRGLV